MLPFILVPSLSGPRWASRLDISASSRASGAVPSRQYRPAIPHIMVKVGTGGLKGCEGRGDFPVLHKRSKCRGCHDHIHYIDEYNSPGFCMVPPHDEQEATDDPDGKTELLRSRAADLADPQPPGYAEECPRVLQQRGRIDRDLRKCLAKPQRAPALLFRIRIQKVTVPVVVHMIPQKCFINLVTPGF